MTRGSATSAMRHRAQSSRKARRWPKAPVSAAVSSGHRRRIGAVVAAATSIAIPGVGLLLAGPIAGAIAGAGAGGATGTLLGALIGAGIPNRAPSNTSAASRKEGSCSVRARETRRTPPSLSETSRTTATQYPAVNEERRRHPAMAPATVPVTERPADPAIKPLRTWWENARVVLRGAWRRREIGATNEPPATPAKS